MPAVSGEYVPPVSGAIEIERPPPSLVAHATSRLVPTTYVFSDRGNQFRDMLKPALQIGQTRMFSRLANKDYFRLFSAQLITLL
jgi:hypothetical protein